MASALIKMHYLYILQSEKTGKYYVGVSNNVQRRLLEHNSSLVKSTAPFAPWLLKKVEVFENIKDAYKRESFIKAKHSRKIIQKIISSQLSCPDDPMKSDVGIPLQ